MISPILDAHAQLMRALVDELFPAHLVKAHVVRPVVTDEVPLFSVDVLLTETTSLMRNRKAPAPDNVPSESLKVIASSCPPRILLNMYNSCLRERVFPQKEAGKSYSPANNASCQKRF